MSKKRIQVVNNALLMPLFGPMDKFHAGVYHAGKCLDASLLYRYEKLNGCPYPQEIVSKASDALSREAMLKGLHLFGGYLFRHYGHFLIETLSRVWALKQCEPVPIIFSSTHREIMRWQRQIFVMLGLRNPIVLFKQPLQVEQLLLAAPGFTMPDKIIPEQIAALASMPAPRLTDRKIWLSRSSYRGGGLHNERELEKHLEADGWEIIHMELLPLRRQVALIASSARVAGLDGSAFHTALLAKEIRGRFDIFFLRNTGRQAYTPIAEMKGFEQKEIALTDHVEFLVGQGAERFFRLKDIDFVLDMLSQG